MTHSTNILPLSTPKPPLYIVRQRFHLGAPINRWASDFTVITGKATLLSDIIGGQVEGVQHVLEVFEDEGTCRDVTADTAIDVANRLEHDQPVLRGVLDFIEEHGGPAFARELRAVERTFSAG